MRRLWGNSWLLVLGVLANLVPAQAPMVHDPRPRRAVVVADAGYEWAPSRRMAPSTPRASRAQERPRVLAPRASRGRSRVRVFFSIRERRIAWCESKDRYTARNPRSSASGRWQFLKSSWARFMGYEEAYLAPPYVQDRKAREVLDARGTTPWAASRRCWGHF